MRDSPKNKYRKDMPAKSKAQQKLFQMALAVRKGDLPRSKAWKSVLKIADGDMTDEQIRDFCVLEKRNRILNFDEFFNLLENVETRTRFEDEKPQPFKKVIIWDKNNKSCGHLNTPIVWDGKRFATDLAHTIRYVDLDNIVWWRYR